MLVGGLLSSSQIPTASAVTCATKHKYGSICDNSNADISCSIVSPPNHTIIHIGSKTWAVVTFTVYAADPVDGIKKVLIHVTNDNSATKVAISDGGGLYHATWTTLGKGSHGITAACSDHSANTAHNSISISIRK